MSIVSSTYTVDAHAQIDGRKYVTEMHTDSVGDVHRVEYLAPVGADYTAIMNARAVVISNALAQSEFEGMLDG